MRISPSCPSCSSWLVITVLFSMELRPIILGSASERRRNILRAMGVDFEVVIPDVDEVSRDEDPRRTAAENAVRKNEWCRKRYPNRRVLTADTVIEFKERVIGKPSSMQDAEAFFKMFSGNRHTVITAVAYSVPGSEPVVKAVESSVLFKTISDETIRAYFSRVNPLDKAGAYDIDQSGDLIVESFSGSRTNIMGLPAEEVKGMLNLVSVVGLPRRR